MAKIWGEEVRVEVSGVAMVGVVAGLKVGRCVVWRGCLGMYEVWFVEWLKFGRVVR